MKMSEWYNIYIDNEFYSLMQIINEILDIKINNTLEEKPHHSIILLIHFKTPRSIRFSRLSLMVFFAKIKKSKIKFKKCPKVWYQFFPILEAFNNFFFMSINMYFVCCILFSNFFIYISNQSFSPHFNFFSFVSWQNKI